VWSAKCLLPAQTCTRLVMLQRVAPSRCNSRMGIPSRVASAPCTPSMPSWKGALIHLLRHQRSSSCDV
jgi:hypothetical protein